MASPGINVSQLLATDVALDKLRARSISAHEAEQLPKNRDAVLPGSIYAAHRERIARTQTRGPRRRIARVRN